MKEETRKKRLHIYLVIGRRGYNKTDWYKKSFSRAERAKKTIFRLKTGKNRSFINLLEESGFGHSYFVLKKFNMP